MNPKTHFILPPERRPKGGPHRDAPKELVPYIAGEELITAVNLAIFLQRPLLLEGEAGSGKSQLALHVAHELGLPFYEWLVRSTSRAEDGLYTYDAILRLHDVHLAQLPDRVPVAQDGKPRRDPQYPMDYVTFGALGKAFRLPDCPAVVLIDEIDKAGLDFPNDLLAVLDEPRKFSIREADELDVEARHPPVVIITSNKEKGNLPAPFLRRCIYYYIDFPSDAERLRDIVDAHYAKREAPDRAVVGAAAKRFLAIRDKDDLFKSNRSHPP